MTGNELHNRLKNITINGEKIVFKDLAQKLELSEPGLQKRFQVKDVGTGFLMKVCNALGIDFIEFIKNSEITQKVNEADVPYATMKDQLLECLKEQTRLHRKVEQLSDELISLYKVKK